MSNATYEFVFFYEPPDFNKPIRQLFVTLDLRIDENDGVIGSYAVTVEGMEIHDRSGLKVTNEFEFLRPKIMLEFYDLHRQRALDDFTGEGL